MEMMDHAQSLLKHVKLINIAKRLYACDECGREMEIKTNHRTSCYEWCKHCNVYITHHFVSDLPPKKRNPIWTPPEGFLEQ